MRYSVSFSSSLDEPSLRAQIDRMLRLGPFALTRCDALGHDRWELEFAPRATHLVVNFAKFAELQIQLARCGEVVALERADSRERIQLAPGQHTL